MKKKTITENLEGLNESIVRYVNARIELLKLQLIENISKIGTFFLTSVFIFFSILLILILLAFAFSHWYANNYGTLSEGFLISVGFVVVIAIIVFLLRKPLFMNSIVRIVSKIIFQEKEGGEK
mgnify:CR=1 FL=1